MKKILSVVILLVFGSFAFSQISLTVSQQNVSCAYGSNGGFTITPAGGTPPYTYSCNACGPITNIVNNIGAGNYTVVVTDAVSNSTSTVIPVTQPSALIVMFQLSQPILCYGANNGIMVADGSQGTPPYSVLWSTMESSNQIVGLWPGTYSVQVTDANGCQATYSTSLTEPLPFNASHTFTNVTCGGNCDGALNMTGNGGNPPYFYQTSLFGTGAYQPGLCAGPLTYTVWDSNSCAVTQSVTISQPQPLSASVSSTNANCGQANGSVCANITGGSGGPYTYIWSNGSTTLCNNNLPAGAYSFTVIDGNGCTASATGLINNIGGPMVSIASQTNATCFGLCNGSALASAIAGTAPYIYAWDNGQVIPTATNLCTGIYNVSVTDAAGCIATASVTIGQSAPVSMSISATTSTCGACNATASSSIINGTPPYSYNWQFNYGATYTTQSVSNLCVGFASVTANDANGCSVMQMISINASSINTMSNVSITNTVTDESCYLSSDGAIALTITGTNTGPFTYVWSNGATTQDIANVISGSYSVTITDANMDCYHVSNLVNTIGLNCGTISGNVFIDSNNDCTKNTGDNDLQNVTIHVSPGNRLGYTNAMGDYAINNLPYGSYTVTATGNNATLTQTCTTVITPSVNSSNPVSSNNQFVFNSMFPSQPDLYVSAYSNGVVPGFTSIVNYYLGNYSSFGTSGVYKAILPASFLANINYAPAGYSISGDTIMWNFNIAGNYQVQSFIVNFTVPVSTPLGSTFSTCIWAQPTLIDLNYVNNATCYQRIVTGSYDPNDKTVSPVGVGPNGDIAASETDLTYLIRFQNTGNGPAVNIMVKDTLSPNVDVNTFEMLSASHNYMIDALPGNVLRWKFNNIMLADSGSNEPASHGYIQYRIKRTNNNTPGTQIKNTAYIYFDFNEPVVTNTAINTIETITGIKSSFNANDEWNVFPNPSTGALYIVNSSSVKEESQIQVINSIGQTVLEETITSNYKNIDLSKLNNGVYFVKIVSDKQSVIKRVVLSR